MRGIIEVMMNQSLGTYGNRLLGGPGAETDILNYLLINLGLRELILSVPLLLDVYPHIVSRVPLVLYLKSRIL